jgi:hypothetical protein
MNNFDTSSTGENIEFDCRFDTCLAQIYFDDFAKGAFEQCTGLNFGRDSTAFLIGDADKPYFKKSALNKMSKQAIFDLCEDYDLLGFSDDVNRFTKAEYISDLLGVTIEQHYKKATEAGWHGFGERITHDFYISRGYSQGDAVYIISLDEALTPSKKKGYDRILWDCPISIRAQINDLELYEDSFLNDVYEYDLDAIKANIARLPISDYAKGWLVDALPDYPHYS